MDCIAGTHTQTPSPRTVHRRLPEKAPAEVTVHGPRGQPYRKTNVEAMARRGTPEGMAGDGPATGLKGGQHLPWLIDGRERRGPAAGFLQCFSPRKWPSFRALTEREGPYPAGELG